MEKITIKTTVGGVSEFLELCLELLVGATSFEQLLPVLVLKELALRLQRQRDPFLNSNKATRITLSPAEAVAVRALTLSVPLPPDLQVTANKVLAIIDPRMPVLDRFVKPLRISSGIEGLRYVSDVLEML